MNCKTCGHDAIHHPDLVDGKLKCSAHIGWGKCCPCVEFEKEDEAPAPVKAESASWLEHSDAHEEMK